MAECGSTRRLRRRSGGCPLPLVVPRPGRPRGCRRGSSWLLGSLALLRAAGAGHARPSSGAAGVLGLLARRQQRHRPALPPSGHRQPRTRRRRPRPDPQAQMGRGGGTVRTRRSSPSNSPSWSCCRRSSWPHDLRARVRLVASVRRRFRRRHSSRSWCRAPSATLEQPEWFQRRRRRRRGQRSSPCLGVTGNVASAVARDAPVALRCRPLSIWAAHRLGPWLRSPEALVALAPGLCGQPARVRVGHLPVLSARDQRVLLHARPGGPPIPRTGRWPGPQGRPSSWRCIPPMMPSTPS